MQLSYFDLVDGEDTPLGTTASFDEVHSKGLWHRAVHILIYTPDKQIVMQKRSAGLRFHPGEVELSVGGGVDAGETPEAAAVREAREELGITVHPEELRYIGKTKFNHHTNKQLNRTFIYSYSACIPKDRLAFTINPEETSSAFLLSERRLRAALRRHRVRRVGKISSTYAYWNYLLDTIR